METSVSSTRRHFHTAGCKFVKIFTPRGGEFRQFVTAGSISYPDLPSVGLGNLFDDYESEAAIVRSVMTLSCSPVDSTVCRQLRATARRFTGSGSDSVSPSRARVSRSSISCSIRSIDRRHHSMCSSFSWSISAIDCERTLNGFRRSCETTLVKASRRSFCCSSSSRWRRSSVSQRGSGSDRVVHSCNCRHTRGNVTRR